MSTRKSAADCEKLNALSDQNLISFFNEEILAKKTDELPYNVYCRLRKLGVISPRRGLNSAPAGVPKSVVLTKHRR